MALAFRCSSHDDRKKSLLTRDRERREESEKLATLYLPARTPGEEPVIPKPEIFDALHNPAENPADLPTIAECAVHLQLLEKFVALKQKVLTSNRLDRAFAIIPKDKLVTKRGKREIQADQTFKARQAVKWPIFVRFAAARFLRWWRICIPILHPQDNRLTMAETSLPPLDVLMIWHAFLSSPTKYEIFCKTNWREDMLKLEFPWLLIHRSLVNDDPSVKLGKEAGDLFTKHVGEVSLFESLACHNDHLESFRVLLESLVTTNAKSRLSAEFPGLRGTPCSDDGWQSMDMLSAIVESNTIFAEKTVNFLWLRSPALGRTLERAIVRYERFMALVKKHPETTLVPALDIRLVLRTQQCSPASQLACCSKLAGRAINWDDTLKGELPKNGIAETSRLYEMDFQEEYHPCLCWYCEAMKSEIESYGLMDSIDYAAIVQKAQDKVMYYKAVELARRKGNPLPARIVDISN